MYTINNNTLQIITTSEESFDCDCCGLCYPYGLIIRYQGETIWEMFSDDHLGGYRSENTILQAILDKWLDLNYKVVDCEATEEKRLEWNLKAPGNDIASTPEKWAEYHSKNKEYYLDTKGYIEEDCQNLPDNETLQVKMIVLWIQHHTDEKFSVEELEQNYHNKEESLTHIKDY